MPSDSILPASPFLMASLRENTRDLHDRAEHRLDIPASLVSRERYQWLLERFYGFYAPLEERLAARTTDWETLDIDFQARRKTDLLRTDLEYLGLSRTAMDTLPRCTALPALESPAGTIGCAYVLEGATLGGQIIARHLEQVLGLQGSTGASFFRSYGAGIGAMWQQFRRAAENYAAQVPEDEKEIIAQQAIASARETFRCLDSWLNEDNDEQHQ